MTDIESDKQGQLCICFDARTKDKLERAALHVHKSVPDFMISSALLSAEKILQEHESLSLSAGDWNVFMNALDNPLTPNNFLRESVELHKKHVSH